MPSARIHEAIAKEINKEFNMDEILLRVGTVAPDSWRNVETKDGFKDKNITHFWDFRIKDGEANNYEEFYLKYYNNLENPFYFGYLLHLITDQYWKTYVDPIYFFNEDGINKVKLKDGSSHEDKNWYSYYEDLKIQKQLCKTYNLGKLPIEEKDIPNFECEIDELNLTGLFGTHGTLNYINNKIMPEEKIEESKIFDLDDFVKYINDTINFIKKELVNLAKLKIEDDKKIKIAVDIDDTLLCTKELENYYWNIFLAENLDISPNQEYTWENPILARFWSEYREKMAFGKPKENAANAINKLLSHGYRVDLLSARPLEKYASLKEKLVDYFESLNINYTYMNLGFRSKKDFLKDHNFDILIDNELKNVKEAELVGIKPILFGPHNPEYSGYQTDNWKDIPSIIEQILNNR